MRLPRRVREPARLTSTPPMSQSAALLLITAVLVLASATAHAQFDGAYAVTGTDQTGSSYEGTLSVEPQGDVRWFIWERRLWGDAARYWGSSLHDGDVVAVAFRFYNHDDGASCSTALYGIDESGTGGIAVTLEGPWAPMGSAQTGTEVARIHSVEPGSLAGRYRVNGTNHDLSPYTEDLTIEDAGGHYRLLWETNEVRGVGLRVGSHLAVAYGDDSCVLMAYERQPDGSLAGTWVINDAGPDGGSGTERAVRR